LRRRVSGARSGLRRLLGGPVLRRRRGESPRGRRSGRRYRRCARPERRGTACERPHGLRNAGSASQVDHLQLERHVRGRGRINQAARAELVQIEIEFLALAAIRNRENRLLSSGDGGRRTIPAYPQLSAYPIDVDAEASGLRGWSRGWLGGPFAFEVEAHGSQAR